MTDATATAPAEVIYKVSIMGMFGDMGFKLFKHKKDARRHYEELIANARKDENRVKPGDDEGKNFVRTKGDEFHPNWIETCSFKYWHKTSYEYDEYDVSEDVIVLSTVSVY